MTITGALRKSAVLAPSSLPCLSTIPTVNLTAGCLHGCLYCYARSYRQYPGEGNIVLYENTFDKLRAELARCRKLPRAVYFSPSSDLFQPVGEVLDMGEAIIEFLLERGIAVSFLTKGYIPDRVLRLLCENPALVSAQIGLISLDEEIIRTFEPHTASIERRLFQMERLVRAGIPTQARIDPILPSITDGPAALDSLLVAISSVGVKQAAIDVLFLRPAITWSLRKGLKGTPFSSGLLKAFASAEQNGRDYSWRLPLEVRLEMFDRTRELAAAHGVEAKVCACENPDVAHGSCNIAGKYPRLSEIAMQSALGGIESPSLEHSG